MGQEEALALKKKIEEEAKAQKIIANDRERARYIVNAEKAKLDGMELSLEKRRQLEACLLRDRVKKKTSQVGFLGFLGVFFGFFLGFCFFLFFYTFAQKREFLRFFSFKNTLRCIRTLNYNLSH